MICCDTEMTTIYEHGHVYKWCLRCNEKIEITHEQVKEKEDAISEKTDLHDLS